MKKLVLLLHCAVLLIVVAGCCVPLPELPSATPSVAAKPTAVVPSVPPTSTPAPPPTPTAVPPTTEPRMTLSSTAFDSGGEIPLVHAQRTFDAPGGWTVACPGENVSPPLEWSTVPPGTESLVLTCLDHIDLCEKCESLAPDNRAWPHWGIYNLPPTVDGLPAGLSAESSLPDGALQTVNGYGEIGYGGPCPQPGHTHTYVFTLYALDTKLDLPGGTTVDDLNAAIDGHVLAEAELRGTFTGR